MGDEMKYSIDVQNLWKAYHQEYVVSDVSFQVKEGEVFAFLGPNGAGKSTTISILTTLLSFDRGNIQIGGYTLGKQDYEIRQSLGVVFQDSRLDRMLSVKQNLMIRCGLYGVFGAQAKHKVDQLFSCCQLEEIKDHKVQTLSGGQRRRVDIARALISNPSILILDEPSTGLDPQSRKELWANIIRLHKGTGLTIFMTTHYMEEAEIANHICMIQKGTIILDKQRENLNQAIGKDQLLLYTSTPQNVCQILRKCNVSYVVSDTCIQVDVMNMYQIMSLLRKCEIYLQRFELKKRTIEDMYLELLKEECE